MWYYSTSPRLFRLHPESPRCRSRAEQSEAVRVAAAALAKARGPVTHVANGEEFEYRAPGGKPTADRPSHIANFTKGLPHDTETGLLLKEADYELFVKGIDSGDPADFLATPLGPPDKAWLAKFRFVPPEPVQGVPALAPAIADGCPHRPGHPLRRAADGGSLAVAGWAQTATFEADPKKPKPPVTVRAWESAGAGLTFDLEGPDAQSLTMPPAPRLDSAELAARDGRGLRPSAAPRHPRLALPRPGRRARAADRPRRDRRGRAPPAL